MHECHQIQRQDQNKQEKELTGHKDSLRRCRKFQTLENEEGIKTLRSLYIKEHLQSKRNIINFKIKKQEHCPSRYPKGTKKWKMRGKEIRSLQEF